MSFVPTSLIRCLMFSLALTGSMMLGPDPAHAGRRGAFAHHSHVKVWHGHRIGTWSHPGRWSHWPHWKSGWGWSRNHGYPHRWWSWNARRHPHFASRRHGRHALNPWGHRWQNSRWADTPRRQGMWYASPGFGSAAPRTGPVRQGEWHAD